MTRFRAVLFFMLVAALALGTNAFAGKATYSESFLAAHHTTNQTAILGAFLACIIDSQDAAIIDTALSFSNITGNPGADFMAKEGSSYYSPDRMIGEVEGLSGGLTAYLYDAETGDALVVPLPVEIGSGQTFTVQLCDAVRQLGGNQFIGYAWVIADFGAVSGTVTNLWLAYGGGVAGTVLMEPVLGGIPVEPASMEP